VLDEYDRMSEEFGFHVIDAVQPIEAQQKQFRALVSRELQSYLAPYLAAKEQKTGNESKDSTVRRAGTQNDG
ncbi:MAG TPA: hypothetical protein PLV10_11395, partial [Candidatus Latescibacteria bacterium]|nr:hypothetical protein [Candidatus Latescibacterota bacterium]